MPASESEKDLRQDQNAEGLPVRELVPAGRRRERVIPQQHHEPAEQEEGRDGSGDDEYKFNSTIYHDVISSYICCSRLRKCSTA